MVTLLVLLLVLLLVEAGGNGACAAGETSCPAAVSVGSAHGGRDEQAGGHPGCPAGPTTYVGAAANPGVSLWRPGALGLISASLALRGRQGSLGLRYSNHCYDQELL